jgi:Trk K+ transport system NAD-binding subunit
MVTMLRDSRQSVVVLLAVVLILVLLIAVALRNRYMLARFENLLERVIERNMKSGRKFRTVDEVLKLNDDFSVAEVILDDNCSLVGMQLKDTGSSRISSRCSIRPRLGDHPFSPRRFVFQPADKIVVYGRIDSIKNLMMKRYGSLWRTRDIALFG